MSSEEKEEETKKQYSRRARRTTRSSKAESEEASASASALSLLVSPEGTTTRRSPPQDHDDDDDGSSIDTASTPPPPPPRNPATAASASSIIYEDFDELFVSTMTDTDHDYLARLDEHHKKPISEPNLSDVAATVLAIGNVLQHESNYYGSNAGLAFLVDDEDTQMLRGGIDPDNRNGWTVAVEPTQPSIPTVLDASGKLKFELDTKNYQIFRACTAQVLKLLEKLFPVLKGNKNSLGMYPAAFTARQAIVYITTHYGSAGRKRAAAAEYRTECHSMKYNHSAAGPMAFLQKLGQLQYRLDRLGEMTIPDSELITLSQIAFRASVPITAINLIFTAWDAEVTTNNYTPDNSWVPFQAFFATALVKAWTDYGPNTDHHGSAALLRERVSELENNQNILDTNIQEIHTSYSAVGGGRSIPGTVLTDESSEMQTQMNKIESMLLSLQDSRSTSTGNDSRGDRSRGDGFRGNSGGGRGGGRDRNSEKV